LAQLKAEVHLDVVDADGDAAVAAEGLVFAEAHVERASLDGAIGLAHCDDVYSTGPVGGDRVDAPKDRLAAVRQALYGIEGAASDGKHKRFEN
jgi:hypothetical protein